MPAFVLVPASPSDLEAVARVQFASCAADAGFRVIFPKGSTSTAITHFIQSYENDMDNDPSYHIMLVKEAMTGELVSFAIWHFFPHVLGTISSKRCYLTTSHFLMMRIRKLAVG